MIDKNVIICCLDDHGYGFEVLEYLETLSIKIKGYLDVRVNEKANIFKIRHLGDFKDYSVSNDKDVFVIGTLDIEKRLEIIDYLKSNKCKSVNVIHPTSYVSKSAILGEGIIIGPKVVIMSNTYIGNHCVLNTLSSFGHHSRMGDNNIFSSNSHIAGNVNILDNNFFGISTSVMPEIKISSFNKFNAGVTVDSNVENRAFYFSNIKNKSLHIY